jgi:hypothetical protein
MQVCVCAYKGIHAGWKPFPSRTPANLRLRGSNSLSQSKETRVATEMMPSCLLENLASYAHSFHNPENYAMNNLEKKT